MLPRFALLSSHKVYNFVISLRESPAVVRCFGVLNVTLLHRNCRRCESDSASPLGENYRCTCFYICINFITFGTLCFPFLVLYTTIPWCNSFFYLNLSFTPFNPFVCFDFDAGKSSVCTSNSFNIFNCFHSQNVSSSLISVSFSSTIALLYLCNVSVSTIFSIECSCFSTGVSSAGSIRNCTLSSILELEG